MDWRFERQEYGPRPERGSLRGVLYCEGCGAASLGRATGWRAYLTDTEDPPVFVVILCPDCARRELGAS
jgi:hypothetical protein